ncbi:ABC transporter [Aeromicrobium flavum]|uniref:ABC transporter n=1 Tax=Aeromicrobium flavum TaxID=416568 RepID=A0A512HS08_9ACTN|nr:metal ABC transporter ATP-binding protein [Aeromicrobium flavum]GEO88175.1 ABC transporter [Aeromicrobium flavum]
MTTTPVIDATGVTVDLGGTPVLRGVDLRVLPGEFVTILGANGSGKSTLVRALVGLIPHRGSIELFGTPLAQFGDRRRIGYMAQRPDMFSGVPATVTEVVLSGALSRRPRFGWPTRSDRAAAAELIDRVGLSRLAKRPITHLSGGQQQRAHIARALVANPDLVVMDEPMAGIDAHSAEVFARLLGELEERGTAIVMVAHELGPLAPLVDRAVHLEGGLVEYEGPAHGPGTHDHAHDHAHSSEPATTRPVPAEGPLGGQS